MEESSVVADDVGNPVCDLLLEQEVLMVEDDFAVNVLHEDPERLRRAVHLLVPLEVWRDRQLHTQGRPGRVENTHKGNNLFYLKQYSCK